MDVFSKNNPLPGDTGKVAEESAPKQLEACLSKDQLIPFLTGPIYPGHLEGAKDIRKVNMSFANPLKKVLKPSLEGDGGAC